MQRFKSKDGGAQCQICKGRMPSEAGGVVFISYLNDLRHQKVGNIAVWEFKPGALATKGSDVCPSLR